MKDQYRNIISIRAQSLFPQVIRITLYLTPIFLILLLTNTCSDETSESSELINLSGVWELTTNVTSNTCGMTDGTSNTDRIIIIQCDKEVNIIEGDGIWAIGTVQGDRLDVTGSDVQSDETGCQSTYSYSGTVIGTSTELEGSFQTNITFDSDSCVDKPNCTVETSVSLSLISNYESSCIDRDDFGIPSESEYILPWPVGKSYVLNNSYCVPGGHQQQQAYDFLIPIGDPIIASRAGIVRQVKEDSPDDGQGSDHNHVMIEHGDGTVGFYAHLKQNGVMVQVGENVKSGQTIALAGYSGTTDVVHLHFGVYSSWPPAEGNDRAINFRNMIGPIDCRRGLVNGATYTAQ